MPSILRLPSLDKKAIKPAKNILISDPKIERLSARREHRRIKDASLCQFFEVCSRDVDPQAKVWQGSQRDFRLCHFHKGLCWNMH